MSDDPAPRLNPAKFRSGIVAGGGADPADAAGVNDEPDPGGGGGGVNSNVLAVLARVPSSPFFLPLFLPPFLPPFLPVGVRRLDDDDADAPIAKVPGARGVPLETSDAKDAFGENGFAFAFAFGENGEGFGEERFGEKRFGEKRFGENGGDAANPAAPEPGRRRPPDASTPPGEKKSNGGGDSGVPEKVASSLGLAVVCV